MTFIDVFFVREGFVLGLSWRYPDEEWSVAKMVIVGFSGDFMDFHGSFTAFSRVKRATVKP